MASIIFDAGASVTTVLIAIAATPNCMGVALVIVAVLFSIVLSTAIDIERARTSAPSGVMHQCLLTEVRLVSPIDARDFGSRLMGDKQPSGEGNGD
jgi:hypothetical protein